MHRLAALLAAALLATGLFACGVTEDEHGEPASSPIVVAVDAGLGPDAGPAPDAGQPARECEPNTSQQCSSPCINEGGGTYEDGGYWYDQVCATRTCQPDGTWGPCELNTPLVLAFDGEPVQLGQAGGHFELGQGALATTDWPTARTPWLVLDRDGDGRIGDGRELFGSLTELASGARARHGFEALAELDSNRDGRLDASDAAWPQLRLWADADADRRSAPGELTSLAERGVEAIELGYASEPRCDARGNCEVERAALLWRDARGCQRRGAVVDVHLRGQARPLAAR